MTPAATPEALVEALARAIIEDKFGADGVAVIFDPPPEATATQATTLALRRFEAFKAARFLIAGPFAPVLASLQRVTAELDEARAKQRDMHRRAQKAESFRERHRSGFNYLMNGKRKERFGRRAAEAALATATAEAARLRAEVEAKDRALKPFADAAAGIPDSVSDAAPGARVSNDARHPGSITTIAVSAFRAARTALARAATAGEG